jgi:hypothetical protein
LRSAKKVRACEAVDRRSGGSYHQVVNAIEFVTELTGDAVLRIPAELAAQLPRSGRARIIVLTNEDAKDIGGRRASHEQFLRDDSPEDAIYEGLR